jgi:hypothetical protein
MHRSLLAAAVLATAAVAWIGPSEAQSARPYCLQGGRGGTGGMLDCSYHTWEQCLASIGGGGDSCSINPDYRGRLPDPARAQPKRRPPPRQHY